MVSTSAFGSALDRLAPVVGAVTRAHIALYRRTGGRVGHTAPGLPTMLLLDHVGARSGVPRTTPLLYFTHPDAPDALVIVASYGGHPRHPAWFHNLRAHPDTTVQVRDEVRPVHARVADDAERDRLWPAAIATYRPYAGYQRRADEVGRTIPFVVLERRR
ncbi:nitroreductase family deazaflavin-dependent oxidoreductase [Actinomycetospora lutea]|uniref:nitroreductase family deazaflavin-dependent oxidoreductase n=1 Tax=Actinomycetospora lutea TaxID=663604 RepID=UPI002366DF00|nr:nitroreductase family deazaflavin-dependent oxidoreductase [Actinomycetospora lutea]MDD7941338.1 nitroreductase family deazaflavin-dependent oxidoreductase [Actinomycetospora lutea]